MDPIAAELTLAETAAVLRRARKTAQAAMAIPLGLLALAWLVLIPVVLLVGRDHLGPFVGLALLAVTGLAWLRYRRTATEHGIRASVWPWVGVAAVALLGGVAASRGGTELRVAWLNVAGPFIVNALAIAAVAGLLHSRTLAACAVVIAGQAEIVALTMHGDAAVAVELTVGGAVLMGTCRRLGR